MFVIHIVCIYVLNTLYISFDTGTIIQASC